MPTAASKGDTLTYIDNSLRYKTRNDLKLYKEREIESTFLEVIEPNKKNKIIGCIHKHSNVPVAEFTHDYMSPLLEKLSREKKGTILMGDFNINILNCDSDKDTADFVDTIYASSLYLTINTPTRITATSKTLIIMILLKKYAAGNIATSIFDHLTQFLMIRDQTTIFENYKKKEVPKIRKFDKENFFADLTQTDHINKYKHKCIKMIQICPLSCFLGKLIFYIISIFR